MKRLLILVALLGALGLSSKPAVSADASSAWSQVAASYNFNNAFGGPINGTFAQNYHGSDFSGDFHAILEVVSRTMGTEFPPYGGNDVMSASLTHWPDT